MVSIHFLRCNGNVKSYKLKPDKLQSRKKTNLSQFFWWKDFIVPLIQHLQSWMDDVRLRLQYSFNMLDQFELKKCGLLNEIEIITWTTFEKIFLLITDHDQRVR